MVSPLLANKVTPSVIVTSIKGEVSSLNTVDDFKVQMGPTSVGKKINPKTILTTGKTGKVALLFSNGTLITIKPGSRFYLRTYKQLEGIVDGSLDPGKLEEEPTQSELSAHLDYGDLIVKAPKLKKGSSMKLTSPLGTAGVRGTMFQLMAVRNSVTGDIMGGINLISGDIDFTDTGGNSVSLLSGQSIQLATSKLGAPVASQTGELVDLSSTYGPALTDGFAPPPLESIFSDYSEGLSSGEEQGSSSDDFFPTVATAPPVAVSASDWEMIHELATDLFFEIEAAETVANAFSFEDLTLAPTVDIPTPEPEAPVAPALITGETLAGADLEFFQGGHPDIQLLGNNNVTDPLVKIFDNGARMEVEMRAPSEGITWRKIDPWVKALDFLGKDITRGVQISGAPTILLPNKNTAEADAPPVGGKVSYEVTYTIRDLRGLSTVIFRQVDVIATRPTITPLSEAFVSLPLAEVGSFSFFEWINEIEVLDVRGNRLPYDPNKSLGSFHIEGTFNLNEQGVFNNLKLVAIDWRGLQSEYEGVSISVEAKVPEFSGDNEFSAELSSVKLTSLNPPISAVDEFNNSISNVQLIGVSSDTDTREIGTDFRLNQLKQGMTYRLRYQTTDFRDITSEKVIDFSVSVSVPKILNSADFNSSFESINSAKTIEYGDPGKELENWLNSHTAEDYLGNKIEINTTVREDQNARSIDYLKRTNPFNDASNQITYEVSFTAVDSRWQEGVDASWEPFLTVTNRYNLSVKATPPKIDLVFHNPREGLGVSDDLREISFLVQTKTDMKTEFEDDGNFTLYADYGVQPLEDRTLYYRAYAYEGKGDFDITEYVSVVNGVDNSQIKTDESNLEISVNDFAYRKSRTDTILEGGAVLTLNPTVKIKDVISPIISFTDEQTKSMEIEGILPELTLLSFSVKDQVFGNSNDPDYNSYYFPDPGLIIKDNYWDSEDIIDYNGIEIISSYQFVYYYDDETPEPFNDVWEFPNRSLNLANIGNFKVNYEVIDKSDNKSNKLERDVKVTDSRKPVVKLYGANPMYVDLQSILDEESRYQDPGAYAIENLYVEGKGFFDWQTQDDNLAWRKTYQLYDWDLEVFGDELEDQENDLIETTISGYIDDPSTLPTQAVKFKVNYYLTDEANNTGSSSRIVEIRGSPNLYPHIYIVMAHPDFDKGIPSSSNIEGNLATLPSIVWQTEVGVDQFNEEPDAIVFEDLGGGIRNTIDYSTQLFFLDDQNQSQSPPSYGYLLSDYLTKVNYWLNGGVRYYAELFDSTGGNSYNQIASGEDEWRRVIIRYTSNTNELGNYSVRDLEIQLLDTTPPTIIKNTFNDTLLEVGEPFNDPGVVITDVAGSSFTSSTVIDLDHPEGESVETTFAELSTRGFWTTGDFTITYSAEDNFSNQSESQILNLTVQDSKDPHVAVITHDALNKFNAPSAGLDNSDLEYEYSNDPVVSPHSIFENSSTLSTKLKSLSSPDLYDESTVTFSSEIPYLVEDGTKDFLLKASELDSDFINLLRTDPDSLVNGVNDSNSYIEIDDVFGRTFVWYSPLTILFNDGKTLQDPGVLIYEPSSSGVDVSVTIAPVFKEGANNLQDNSQIESISLSLTVQQTNNGARQTIISNIRTYRFLDDIKPLITISPDTDDSTTFIVVEAGSNYDDNLSNGQVYRMSIDGNVDDIADTLLSIQADDVSDGSITSSIVRTITDLNDSSISSVYTSYNFVNHIYKIEYNVQDSGGNAADPVERYLIIKDTIAPLIYPQADANASDNFEIDYLSTSPNVNSTSAIEDHLLSGLVASDYGALGAGVSDTIDGDLDTVTNRNKWSVTITKPITDNDPIRGFDEGRVYPFAKDDNGYVVTVTVTDEFGNISSPRTRSLKIGDYQKPVIGLIGSSTIHDFLRYSTNSGLGVETEEISGQDFNATGFGGGMHRIMLDNYTFVDPGAYAHDYNSYFSTVLGYKDLQDGDGYGETYAMRRVQDRAEMEECADIGVIYVYSALNNDLLSDPFLHYQGLMQNNIYGSDTNVTITPSENVKVPDVDGNSYTFAEENKTDGLHMDVVRLTNEYRVRDGWGNKADIVERTIYIYESRQFPGFAFYATPLTDGDGLPFEHLYDDGSENRAFLNDTRKDTDGDGVSDFWEKAFGSNPLDRNDMPTEDLSDPSIYNGIDFNTSNAQ